MKESTKCRSGRDRERMGFSIPSRRGGKTPHPFSNDERVAAQDDGDVMVPARERAAFEVVEPELALELLIRALGAPSFLDDANDLLLAHAAGHRREDELRRLILAIGPLDHEPHRLAVTGVGTVVVGDLDASEREAGGELATGADAPGEPPKGAATELDAEFFAATATPRSKPNIRTVFRNWLEAP